MIWNQARELTDAASSVPRPPWLRCKHLCKNASPPCVTEGRYCCPGLRDAAAGVKAWCSLTAVQRKETRAGRGWKDGQWRLRARHKHRGIAGISQVLGDWRGAQSCGERVRAAERVRVLGTPAKLQRGCGWLCGWSLLWQLLVTSLRLGQLP